MWLIVPSSPDLVHTMTLSLLEALEFLHSHKWIHGDVKPNNVGVREWNGNHASIVLLDTEDAIYVPGGYARSTPGTNGTVGWLSPERELDQFNATTDVWGVGITALWMLLGRHPWQFGHNPWRDGEMYERNRPFFHMEYEKVTQRLRNGNSRGK